MRQHEAVGRRVHVVCPGGTLVPPDVPANQAALFREVVLFLELYMLYAPERTAPWGGFRERRATRARARASAGGGRVRGGTVMNRNRFGTHWNHSK